MTSTSPAGSTGRGPARAAALVGALLLCGVAAPAYAHGDFETGSPGPGDAVAAGADVLSLRFVSIDPGSEATVTLTRTGQDPLPVGAALPLTDEAQVCARTEPLTPGIYTVTYELSGPDGAVTDGGYVFEVVAAEDAEDALAPGACASAALRPPTAPAASTADSDSAAPMIAAASAVGVVVVGAAIVAVRRRRTDG